MKAMVLTAGLGTRLRPLTLERAKPAVPVCGKPLVLRTIEALYKQGLSSFRLNLSWASQTVVDIFERSSGSDLDVTFSHEPEILGTAGGLKANQTFFDSGSFLMVNGDILFKFEIQEAIRFHEETGALATLVLRPQTPPFQFTPVRIDKDHNITSFLQSSRLGESLPQAYVFTGIHILQPRIFDYIEAGVFYEIISQSYRRAIERGERIMGYCVDGYWNDLGNPARYLQAVSDILAGQMDSPAAPAWIANDSRIHEGAVFGNSSLESGSVIESGCAVTNSIVWENSKVGPNSVVNNCIIGSGIRIQGYHLNEVITLNGSRPVEGWR